MRALECVALTILLIGSAQPSKGLPPTDVMTPLPGESMLRPTKGGAAQEAGTVRSGPPPSIRSRVPELRPDKIKKLDETTIEVTLRNDYKKDITAVATAVDGIVYRREYLIAGIERLQRIAPGASDSFLFSYPAKADGVIDILAVVFGDRTSAGDERQVRKILDERQGMKIQLRRILPHLQHLAKASSVTAPSEFASLKGIVESLPSQMDDGSPMSTSLEYGLKHGRAFILREYVSELEQALANEEVETWYRNGQPNEVRYSPYEHFRMKFATIQKDLMALANRL
jgi:hypothetical protein